MQNFNRPRASGGFSLIELIIAVAIAGLLATIAYPTYLNSVRKSGRSDARTQLNNIANSQEQFFAVNRTYTTDLAALGFNTILSPAGKYKLTVAPGTSGNIATSYTITATPVEGESQADDDACPAFSLDSAGRRVPDPAGSNCW